MTMTPEARRQARLDGLTQAREKVMAGHRHRSPDSLESLSVYARFLRTLTDEGFDAIYKRRDQAPLYQVGDLKAERARRLAGPAVGGGRG